MTPDGSRRRLPIRGEATFATPASSEDRHVVVLDGDARSEREDHVVVEEPLEIRVGGEPLLVTMRTPGHDEELAVGLLLTEGLVPSVDAIAGVARGAGRDAHHVVEVSLASGHSIDVRASARAYDAASACGVCGKSSIAALRVRTAGAHGDEARIPRSVLATLPAAMRAAQATFDATGGLHAAALFDVSGRRVVLREDVGRHNAVDAVVGHALLHDLPLAGHVLAVSGRAGFEIAQKAAVARIPILAAVSAPTTLAIEVAHELGVTLIGFLRPPRATIYTHPARVV